jgi:uncharacterized FlaG/YvyC family protein
MITSSISNGLVLPANLPTVTVKSGSGRPAQIQEVINGPVKPELADHEILVVDVKASIEPIVNGEGLGLRFYLDKDAGVRVIQIIDLETGDIIRQIPPKEVVNFMRHFEEAKGHFVSRRD